ncbi:MAG: hypothetical protein H6729_12890 [Deltaproteobacteria bacterium]|nr:hypothetical protein [Deltaproteobacteria bacterium]
MASSRDLHRDGETRNAPRQTEQAERTEQTEDRGIVELRVRARDLGRPGQSSLDVIASVEAGEVFVETSVVFDVGTAVVLEVSSPSGGAAIRLKAEVLQIVLARGESGSHKTPRTQTRGIALRLADDTAPCHALATLLRSAQRQEASTVEALAPIRR